MPWHGAVAASRSRKKILAAKFCEISPRMPVVTGFCIKNNTVLVSQKRKKRRKLHLTDKFSLLFLRFYSRMNLLEIRSNEIVLCPSQTVLRKGSPNDCSLESKISE